MRPAVIRPIFPQNMDASLRLVLEQFCDNTARFINGVQLLPTHTNNAAALAAGLSVGQLYKTATGNVMVVY